LQGRLWFHVDVWKRLLKKIGLEMVLERVKGKAGKAEHLSSALHGIQITLKRSGMDHTV